MIAVVVSMLVILVIAGAVVLYAAYPHRGEQIPAAPWLGDAMSRAVDSMPLLAEEEHADHRLVEHRLAGPSRDGRADSPADSRADSRADSLTDSR